jgi:exosortase J
VSAGANENVGPMSWATGSELLGRRKTLLAAALLTTIGLLGFSGEITQLWGLWTGDALRSIGLLVPPVSIWLALRAWTWRDWESRGTWWGFALIAIALTLVTLKNTFDLRTAVYFGDRFGIGLTPIGPLLYVYFSGAVLLFGGVAVWRKAWFALLLWLFVNPVPQVVGVIDFPLQTFAAHAAREFASWMSVPVSGDALTLMFSSKLGMFLAPGCNGLRGAATMGYLALVLGHLRGLSLLRLGAFALAAVAFAYVLNLIRLLFVVVYYWLALRVSVLGTYGAEVDYAIGAMIFLAGATFLFKAAGSLRPCMQSS